jgi:hypothetical protein
LLFEVTHYSCPESSLLAAVTLRNPTRNSIVCRLPWSCTAKGDYGVAEFMCGPGGDFHICAVSELALGGPDEVLALPAGTTNFEVRTSIRATTTREHLRSMVLQASWIDAKVRRSAFRLLAPSAAPPGRLPVHTWLELRSGDVPVTSDPARNGAHPLLPSASHL